MKKISYYFVCFFFILLISIVHAQFYQWVDKSGVKRFSDNLLDVPKDQRPNLTVHESIITKDPPTPPPETKRKSLARQQAALEKEKTALTIQYKDLQKKQKELLAQQKLLTTDLYNERIMELSGEIAAYEKKRTTFETKVQKFNKQVESLKNTQ